MITVLVLAAIVCADAAGDVLLTRGLRQEGELSIRAPYEAWRIASNLVRNPNFILSLAFMTIHFVGFLALLSWTDLSFAFPATCLVYAAGTLGAKFFLGEHISRLRWAGTALVCVGVALVSLPG